MTAAMPNWPPLAFHAWVVRNDKPALCSASHALKARNEPTPIMSSSATEPPDRRTERNSRSEVLRRDLRLRAARGRAASPRLPGDGAPLPSPESSADGMRTVGSSLTKYGPPHEPDHYLAASYLGT